MLDYEIHTYTVSFRSGTYSWWSKTFSTEEEAISYIKENRDNWTEYRLTKVQRAVIDF